MKYEIEKSIPLPAPRANGFVKAASSMGIGDSIILCDKTSSHVMSVLQKLRPMKFTSRKVEGGCRVWRIE